MSLPLFTDSNLLDAFDNLRRDLVGADGPRISTMRNYRFAILQYDPGEEFKLRGLVQRLSAELIASGWVVVPINLQQLLLDRVRALGERHVQAMIDKERAATRIDRQRGLNDLRNRLADLIEGPEGIVKDCSRAICESADRHPDKQDRRLALIGRAGALYPFFRSSALLKHLDGQTRNIPAVLLYPGKRRDQMRLSFMGVHEPDGDYRPRIYS